MATKKPFNLQFDSDNIMNVSMTKSKSGYNYVSVGIKLADNQYISIGYEWQGDNIPDFAMDMLSYLSADKAKLEKASESKEYKEFIYRLKECL